MSGILYWLNNKPLYVEKVKEYEKENQAFVYYCILNHTEFGDMLDMLYVSNNVDNWELEREELQEGLVNVFTSDLVNDYYSESGVISISGINGGIVRY